MSNFLKSIEGEDQGLKADLDKALVSLKYNQDGLIPAIAQQHDTGEVLMMAWMNEAAIRETLETGHVCYWSRSRNQYWRKGESSGNQQILVSLNVDCDGDTLLVKVDQTGAACHTGRRDCFYNEITKDGLSIIKDPIQDPNSLYK
ncbi:phosphoribosyl-AMP cyclohydrolase [Bermanella marisrubri]|uniref:Phosphoribosyl-AMP cyclohydrolase n=1 Tax=Bermanella marisrubri TaxID=207949 RepID=Q1N6S6_9GAMM|nr:phosphoribosyl-AMP cyclohydrolase [Bermanella marisrubri]EAT13516.1 Phosphoribosyl-AMP cyclohydrolase [Oceanobacter sp. RED65] [Bermanella marisrubri]QIZ84316.1 phosphoribosyl-AMP cyclohydrolase [Bermanella marisrubri]